MSSSELLGLIGILATIIFGVWGIVIVLRRRYPGEISFVREPYIGLFESIVKNLPELSVQYDDKPIGQGLALIKGALLNSGSKDITETMVEDRLAFNLPEKFRWVKAKIVGASANVRASVAINGNSMSFSTGLFRCSEYICFQAIVEVPLDEHHDKKTDTSVEEQLDKAISITHRIADTKRVLHVDLLSPRLSKRRVRRYLVMSTFMTVVIIMAVVAVLLIGVPADMHYLIKDKNGSQVEVTLKPRLDGSVRAQGIAHKFREQLPATEFFQKYQPAVKVVRSSETTMMAIFGVFYVLFPWTMCAVAYRERRKNERMRKLLELEEKKE
jgi:hypothetical protein